MKSVMILALFAFVAADTDYYVLDKIDLSKMENNIEELKILMDCILDKGACSDLYNSYKGVKSKNKMKLLILLALVSFVAAEEQLYSLQKIDLSNVGENIGEFKKFMDCLLDNGPCSEVYESYRVRVNESLQSSCGKCTPELKRFAVEFFDVLKKYLPQEYDDFLKKYDPENKYFDVFMAEVLKYKV
ncbi:unnamed protein product [Danaus chrysippus]|uniref:(African queen) hypothetical protein n=1 Tax=Danaus chrysippus TaxID=151541 RepID=A0A8J2W1N1_9NEOP|nr:unnamed protein product [Danaus chrysippus]